MKWWHLVLILTGCFLVLGGLYYALYTGQLNLAKDTPPIDKVAIDEPEFSNDEVLAIVKREVELRPFLGDQVFSSEEYAGQYLGAGKWSGTATVRQSENVTVPFRYEMYTSSEMNKAPSERIPFFSEWEEREEVRYTVYKIVWNFYEKSRTVEISEWKKVGFER